MNLVGGTVIAGRFCLVRELGKGGMGSVWLAQDTSLDTPCAIKFIHGQAADSAQMRGRFEREAKSAAQLRSPNVVQILDHGISDGMPYIAMELLDGEDLDHRLTRMGRLGAQETVGIMSQVAKALTRASAAGLVHRDLKPANIFLVRDEDKDIAKVLDFGVAKSTMPELADASTKTGALMGTPYYMSPEQVRGSKTLDHRSDLWALAVIVFQCVTGRLPFLSDSLGDLLMQIATDPIPVPSRMAPDLPPSFDAWWARASMRDPAQRYQTAREFVDALAMAFGLARSGGFAANAAPGVGPGNTYGPGGPGSGYAPSGFEASRPPSGGGSGSYQQPQSAMHPHGGWPPGQDQRPPSGSSSPGFTSPQATVALAPSTQTGVSARSVADKPASSRGPGLIIGGLLGATLLGGGLAYLVAFHRPPAPPAPATSAVAVVSEPPAAPHPTEVPVPQPAPPTEVAPAVPASAATAASPPADSATAKAPSRPTPGPVKGAHNNVPSGHPPASSTPKPVVPNDGI